VGADAVIVPDLPPEEAGTLVGIMNDYPLEPVFMLAPTSTEERIRARFDRIVADFDGTELTHDP